MTKIVCAASLTILLVLSTAASASTDPESCEATNSKALRDQCLLKIGLKTKSLDVCDEISSQVVKDGCVLEVAAFKKDIEICEDIKTDSIELRCQAIVSRRPILCWKAKRSDDKELCLSEVFDRNGSDPAVCKGDQSCFYRLAFHKGDMSLCPKAGKLVGDCYNFLLRRQPFHTLTPEICKGQADCEHELAVILKKPEFCPKDEKKNSNCVAAIEKLTK